MSKGIIWNLGTHGSKTKKTKTGINRSYKTATSPLPDQ